MKKLMMLLVLLGVSAMGFADPDYAQARFYSKMKVSGGKNGGQHVMTDYSPNSGTIIRARYSSTRANTKNDASNQCLYCARHSTTRNTTDKPDFSFFISVNGKARFDYADKTAAGAKSYVVGDVYDLEVKNGTAVVTDTTTGTQETITIGERSFDPHFPLALFASYSYNNGSPNSWGNCADIDFYYLEIYEVENGEEKLVRRYIPCKVADTIYVADTVNESLFSVVTPTKFSVDDNDLLSIDDRLEITGTPEGFGVAVPAYGIRSGLKAGDTLTLTAPTVCTNAEETVAATCCGWKLYTYDSSTASWHHDADNPEHAGEGNSYTYVHPTPAAARRLEWQYRKEVYIATTAPDGMVVTGGGWYEVGTTVSLTAIGDSTHGFSKWTGLAEDASALSATTRFAAKEPLLVTANFGAILQASSGAEFEAALAELGAAGGTILLADTGDAPITFAQTVTISAPVRVIGHEGDASRVVIDGEDKIRPFILDHPDAYLSWLTVRRGATPGGTVGGCVQITSNGGVIEDCRLERGKATASWNSSGGCLGMNAGRVTRTVMANGACGTHPSGTHGAGIYATAGLIEDCLVVSNNCSNAGSAVYLNGPVLMINCTVTENYGNSYADVHVNNSGASVVNCAIFANRASTDTTGHGHVWRTKSERFFKCAADAAIDNGTACILAESAGFKNPAGGDFRLTSASCCLDSGYGRDAYSVTSQTDLLGNPRAVGAATDIGCYENQQNEPEITIVSASGTFLVPSSVTLTAQVAGLSGPATFIWKLNNALSSGNPLVYEVSDNMQLIAQDVPAGLYDVGLTVRVGGASYEAISRPAYFQVAPRDIYASPANPNAAYPYATPETAASDIQTAVDAAVDGTRVHVLPGDSGRYDVNSAISIQKGISVIGETGNPLDVWIYGSGNTRSRAFYINHAEALLANVSASGASRGNGKTVCVEGAGGTVSNCVFTTSSTGADWSTGGIISGTHAHFTRCVLYGYSSMSTGDAGDNGAAARLYTDSLLENSLVTNVTYTAASGGGGHIVSAFSRSSVVNCTLTDCRMPDENGSALYADNTSFAINCAVIGCTKTVKNYEYIDNGDETVTTNLVSTVYPVAPWSGTASRFMNCATDGESVINETCVLATTAAFKDYAAGDLRPVLNGALYDAGAAVEGADSAVDFAGRGRVVGKSIDIGCYECTSKNGTCVIVR